MTNSRLCLPEVKFVVLLAINLFVLVSYCFLIAVNIRNHGIECLCVEPTGPLSLYVSGPTCSQDQTQYCEQSPPSRNQKQRGSFSCCWNRIADAVDCTTTFDSRMSEERNIDPSCQFNCTSGCDNCNPFWEQFDIVVRCPGGCQSIDNDTFVYGGASNRYSPGSGICKAALHAGRNVTGGGLVRMYTTDYFNSYGAVLGANGIQSMSDVATPRGRLFAFSIGSDSSATSPFSFCLSTGYDSCSAKRIAPFVTFDTLLLCVFGGLFLRETLKFFVLSTFPDDEGAKIDRTFSFACDSPFVLLYFFWVRSYRSRLLEAVLAEVESGMSTFRWCILFDLVMIVADIIYCYYFDITTLNIVVFAAAGLSVLSLLYIPCAGPVRPRRSSAGVRIASRTQ